MPDYLLELFSEEIPARMQAQAARDLERLARERLGAAELPFEALQTFSGPRRLTLHVVGLPLRQADRTEERRGPKLGAPTAALDGFLRSTGLRAGDLIERDGAYWAVISKPGLETRAVLGALVAEMLAVFPWPKSMRSGSSSFRWVRPLRRILSVFDGETAPVALDGLEAGAKTEGHRFMGARGPFEARTFDAYKDELERRFVVLERARRRDMIAEGARTLCAEAGLELVEDLGLLEEVAGLAEWPAPILGEMDPAFLVLPPEVVRTSMRTHQKYFAVSPRGSSSWRTSWRTTQASSSPRATPRFFPPVSAMQPSSGAKTRGSLSRIAWSVSTGWSFTPLLAPCAAASRVWRRPLSPLPQGSTFRPARRGSRRVFANAIL
jgi:glycyl-tRNA synthetase beta chain